MRKSRLREKAEVIRLAGAKAEAEPPSLPHSHTWPLEIHLLTIPRRHMTRRRGLSSVQGTGPRRMPRHTSGLLLHQPHWAGFLLNRPRRACGLRRTPHPLFVRPSGALLGLASSFMASLPVRPVPQWRRLKEALRAGSCAPVCPSAPTSPPQ